MKELALMFGSCFVTLIGFYVRSRSKNVGSWMQGKRIDTAKKVDTGTCDECGASMKRRTYKSGHREGASALVCNNYPDCKNVKWG